MPLDKTRHPDDESVERYAMQSLQEPEFAQVEEHLLTCPECQHRLEQIDAFVEAVRGAASKLEQEDESRKQFWSRFSELFTFRKLAWSMALVAMALAFVALRIALNPNAGQPIALVLESSRDAAGFRAQAKAPLDITMDLRGLPEFSTYHLKIVNAEGQAVWQSTGKSVQEKIQTRVPNGLVRGVHFVRVYSPSEELLREFALQIQ